MAYYPFYHAAINGKELQITKGENNIVKIIVPAGLIGTIQLYYKAYLSWRLADLISFVALLLFVTGFFPVFNKKSQRQLRRLLDK